MITIGIIIALVIATEAATELVVASEFPLFLEVRRYLAKLAAPDVPTVSSKQYVIAAIYKLFSCGYCYSVWVAGFFACFAPTVIAPTWANWLCVTLVLHRLANWLHVAFEIIKKGRINSHDITLTVTGAELLEDEDGEP